MLRTDGNPEQRVFDPVSRFLHWLTVFLVATTFVLAFSIDSFSSEEAVLLQLHRSCGVTVWAVTLGRLVWRQFARFPNWPADMPQAMRFAAHWSEYAMYTLLLIQPILGILQTNARGGRVLSSPNPFIVVCRKVQQTSLGKLVCVLRKKATAFGMRFQKVRVHGKCPHSTTHSIFAQRIGSIYREAPLLRFY